MNLKLSWPNLTNPLQYYSIHIMAKKKTTGLANTLNTGLGKKVELKKKGLDTQKVEKVSEKLHSTEQKPKETKVPLQKMTIEIPKELHTQIKIKVAQEGKKIKEYIIQLVENDLGL